jgi:hypothetical protein
MRSPAPKTRPAIAGFLAAVSLLTLTAGGLMLSWAAPLLLRGHQSWSYIPVSAEISQSRIVGSEAEHGTSWRVEIEYAYAYGTPPTRHPGRDQLMHGTGYRDRLSAERAVAQLAPGGPLTVYIDPERVDRSVLTPGVPMRVLLAAGWSLPVLAIGFTAAAFATGMLRSPPIPQTQAPLGPVGIGSAGLTISVLLLIGWSKAVTAGWLGETAWSVVGLWGVLLVCWVPLVVAVRSHAPWRWM